VEEEEESGIFNMDNIIRLYNFSAVIMNTETPVTLLDVSVSPVRPGQ
jgi:hypothetical protein